MSLQILCALICVATPFLAHAEATVFTDMPESQKILLGIENLTPAQLHELDSVASSKFKKKGHKAEPVETTLTENKDAGRFLSLGGNLQVEVVEADRKRAAQWKASDIVRVRPCKKQGFVRITQAATKKKILAKVLSGEIPTVIIQ